MALRMTGLMSGLDTESIVSALMQAQTMKKTKIDNKKTKLEWKQEAWSKVNTKLYNFYKGSLSKMRLQSSFLTKAASSSNTTKVTATAKSTAANGTYAVKVNKLAAAQYVTSGKLDETDEGKVTSKTKLSKLKNAGFAAGSQIKITADKAVTLNIDNDTTVADFVSAASNAGLNATFDEDQQRFFISAKKSGEKSNFSIQSKSLDATQVTARDDLWNAVSYGKLSASQKSTVNTVLSNLQNIADFKDTAAVEKEKEAALKSLIGVSDAAAKSAATKHYTDELTKNIAGGFAKKSTTVDSNTVEYYDKSATGTGSARQYVLDNSSYVADDIDKMSDEEFDAEVKSLVSKKVNEELSTEAYKNNISNAVKNGLSAAGIDRKAKRDDDIKNKVDSFVNAVSSGVASSTDAGTLNSLGLSNLDGSKITDDKKQGEYTGSDMSIIAAKDSEIEFNGAKLTSSETTMTISGLTLNLLGATNGETVNINVTKDTTAVYDEIKDFLNEYNSVLQELNGKYNAASARGYDVLTAEEKEAMTDDEIEKWEGKIKDSLLRRDTTLGGLVTTLRTNMSGSYKASNGKTYSLANLGITTSAKNYSEGGLLHIKGDEDDTEFADDTNKLKEMLEKDPDAVMEVITGLAGNLYSELQKKMSTTRLSSALTFYNDKEMNSQLSDYKKQIKKWENKLADMEDRYYKQFTAMEKAMASMQSQQNALSSYLGGGM